MEKNCIRCGKPGEFLDGWCSECKRKKQESIISTYRSLGFSEQRISEKIKEMKDLETYKIKSLSYKPKFTKASKYGVYIYCILFVLIAIVLFTGNSWLKGNHFLLFIIVALIIILTTIAAILEHHRIKNDSYNFYKRMIEIDKMFENNKNTKEKNGNN